MRVKNNPVTVVPLSCIEKENPFSLREKELTGEQCHYA